MGAAGRSVAHEGERSLCAMLLQTYRHVPERLLDDISTKIHELAVELREEDLVPERRKRLEKRTDAWRSDLVWLRGMARSYSIVREELLFPIMIEIHGYIVALREDEEGKKEDRMPIEKKEELGRMEDFKMAELSLLRHIAQSEAAFAQAAVYSHMLSREVSADQSSMNLFMRTTARRAAGLPDIDLEGMIIIIE